MRLGVGRALVAGRWVAGDVEVDDGVVTGVGLAPAGPAGRSAAPGFVDLQVNGVAGVDLSTASVEGWTTAGAAIVATGVTAFQPTFVTAPADAMLAALRGVPASIASGPRVLGAHLEGPFLSPARLGAHPAEHRRDPDVALLERFLGAGTIGQMTLAPELPGAGAVMTRLLAAGATVSLGHTDADAATAAAAFDAGASTVTHLFNAMRSPSHRDPGVAYTALARADVVVQIIADGHHLAWETVLLAWRAAGEAGRLALVTDAVHHGVAGAAPPQLADGTLAGSSLTMIAAVGNLVALGVPLEGALAAASTVPAGVARRPDLGRLEPGAPADIVVLDDTLAVVATLVGGQ